MSSIDTITTRLTYDESKAFIYSALTTAGVKHTSWSDDSVARVFVVAMAATLSLLSILISLLFKSGFLSTAEGDYVDVIGEEVYDTPRQDDTFASGECTIVNSGGGVWTFDPGDMIVSSEATGKTYKNAVALSIGVGDTLTGKLFVAVEAGRNSNALPDTIDTIVSPSMPSVTITNPDTFSAVDRESDNAYKTRCKASTGALSPNGPLDAYDYVAKNATRRTGDTTALVGVTRTRYFPNGDGTGTLYVAGASGAIDGTANDETTDLGSVNWHIQRKVVPQTNGCTVASAESLEFNIVAEIWMYDDATLDDDAIETQAGEYVSEVIETAPIGGTVVDDDPGMLFNGQIDGAIREVSRKIFKVVITSPAADTELEPQEVPSYGGILLTINRVPNQ